MKIETKYNIGDTLYYLRGSSIRSMDIAEIRVMLSKVDTPMILYGLCNYAPSSTLIDEDTINVEKYFTSKEKLLASLCNYYGTNKERTL